MPARWHWLGSPRTPPTRCLLLMTAMTIGVRLVHAADCNSNGIEDSVDLSSGTSADCNLDSVPDECENFAVRLTPFADPTNLRGTAIDGVIGDWTGDGVPEVVVATIGTRPGTARVEVFQDDDASGFRSIGALTTSFEISDLDLGDVDGDGDLDIVTAGDGVATIISNDAGSLRDPEALQVTGLFRRTRAVSLDADGLAEILLLDADANRLVVLQSRRAGVFAEPRTYELGDSPLRLSVSDLDGDGDPDVVATAWRGDVVSIFVNDGTGALSEIERIATDDPRPREVAMLPRPESEFADLVISTRSRVTAYARTGRGIYEPYTTILGTPRELHAGDFNGDGKPDIAMLEAGAPFVTVLFRADDGTLRGSRTILGIDGAVRATTSGDLDRDGDPDLVAFRSEPNAFVALVNGDDSERVSMSQARYAIGQPPHTAEVGDLDGDGDVDFLSGNGLVGTISVVTNDGNGEFRVRQTTKTFGYLNSITVADMDRDGDLDAVTADHQSDRVFIVRNRGDAFLESESILRVDRSPWYVTTAELNGDGRLDIIACSETLNTASVILSTGETAYAPWTRHRVGGRPVCAIAADVDEDNDVDICVANETSGDISLLRNLGDGSFDAQIRFRANGRPTFLVAGDLDADGRVDLVTCNQDARSLSVLSGGSDGKFGDPRVWKSKSPPYSARLGDFNHDGYLDVLTANRAANNVSVLMNGGDGSLIHAADFRTGTGGQPRFAPVADLDGNGSIDAMVANHDSDEVVVLLNQYAPPFEGDYLAKICTREDFRRVTVASTRRGSVLRQGKFVAPARDDERLLPVIFQNSSKYRLHLDFLEQVFPERFGGMTTEEYDQLVARRATREYFVGFLQQVRAASGATIHSFTVVADTGRDIREAPALDEVRRLHGLLSASFTLDELWYSPSDDARRVVADWVQPGFPIYLDDGTNFDFEPYTKAIGYGRVRVYDRAAFDRANESGRFTFQDVLVLDFAPADVLGVIGGIITAAPQADLSHLSVRTARRGTPNAYVARAHERFRDLDGALVRIEVSESGVTMTPAAIEDAEAHWDTSRPTIGTVAPIDATYRSLDGLLELELGEIEGLPVESVFGGKASNLARLQRILVGPFEKYAVAGFAIPVAYYVDFMRSNRILSHSAPPRFISYAEYVEELFRDPAVLSDSALRFRLLEDFRDRAENSGRVDSEVLELIARRIGEVYGRDDIPVRFRSSSNVEDLLEFNGAGLYESTSGCLADDRDDDERGPSICNPDETNERGLARALKRVWMSLWTFRAVEERSYYRIPQEASAMAILCNAAFADERANGVAFTGNPGDVLDRRFFIAAQIGEESVVTPEPGQIPERDLLEVAGGEVIRIQRQRSSSLVGPEETVLSDEQLRELGAFLSFVDARFPIDTSGRDRRQILLDFEFKIEHDGSLGVKQVRPFLIPGDLPPTPTFTLEIDTGLSICAQYNPAAAGRDIREMWENRATIEFVAGPIAIPTDRATLAVDLIREIRYGPSAEIALAGGPGILRITRIPEAANLTRYAVAFEQEFRLSGGRVLEVFLREGSIEFSARGEVPLRSSFRIDDVLFASQDTFLVAEIDGIPAARFASCEYSESPLFETVIELSELGEIRLYDRFAAPDSSRGEDTGTHAIVAAELDLGGTKRRVVESQKLVLTARRHNLDVVYWIEFDPRLSIPGFDAPVRIVEVRGPGGNEGEIPPEVWFLDERLERIRSGSITEFRRSAADSLPETIFRRGEVLGDGRVDLTDAIEILRSLFQGSGPLACDDAADIDDDGRLTVTDAVRLLRHLFAGGPAPAEPFATCGSDASSDELDCESEPPCP
jgi:hypothetical protein